MLQIRRVSMPNQKPYAPSWTNHFLDWLNSLPIPIWLSIALIYLLAVIAFHSAYWIEGALPFGALGSAELLVNGVWSIIGIAFLLFLNRSATAAIDKFSVLVPQRKKELEMLRYQMTTIPSGVALAFTVLMILVIGGAVYFDPTFLGSYGLSNPISMAIMLSVGTFSYVFAPLMIYQGIRQLVLVTRAYQLVEEINLFRLQPLYAFSGLTMVSSLFWILILNLDLVSNYATPAQSTADFAFTVLFGLPNLLLAFATFIVPLWGIHRRIQNKKEKAIEENGMQIEKTHRTLYALLKKASYKKTADIEKSLASLYRMREQIEKVPTWPWNAGTLRGFLSAVFLPLGIWLAQQIISRFL